MEIAHWRIRDLVFIIIGTMNLLWSILPHLYMLLTPQTPRNHLNTSSSLPLSSLGTYANTNHCSHFKSSLQ